jgi:2-(1,2-epoxy-1,2-dihydrophenyl)acetyl-CoA isomerase
MLRCGGISIERRASPQRTSAAIGLTKQLIGRSLESSLDGQLDEEARLQAIAAAGDDFAEGVAAFLEKRPPRFTGS